MAEHKLIKVEVAYALPHEQKIIALEVREGMTVFEAAQISGISEFFDGLDLTAMPMGVFGKLVKHPRKELVHEGQRVEIYRPLIIDPKVARANRAARAAAKAAKKKATEATTATTKSHESPTSS